MLDSWSVYLTLYRISPLWTRDLCIWHYTEWCWTRDLCVRHYTEWCWTRDLIILYNVRYIGHESNMASFCKCQIHRPRVQHGVILFNVRYRSRVQHGSILYNVRYTDHDSDMPSFCIMSDAQITSLTWRHSVQCQMHRSRVQHGVILYNVRCTDHESNMASFCTMSDAQITSPTLRHPV